MKNSQKQIIGEGTKEDPIVINELDHLTSSAVQTMLVEAVCRNDPEAAKTATRQYHLSPRGKPGNRDLCETQLKISGLTLSLWFDLSNVTANVERSVTESAQNQLVVDQSPQDQRPTAELRSLNQSRKINGLLNVGFIDRQPSSFANYGRTPGNPIVVCGITGLSTYIKSLRFVGVGQTGTQHHEFKGLYINTRKHGDYPVDCFRLQIAPTRADLYFCIYGIENDTINPEGFLRIPFLGKFDYSLDAVIDVSGRVGVIDSQGNEIALVNPGGKVFLKESCPTEAEQDMIELCSHILLYNRVLDPVSRLTETNPSAITHKTSAIIPSDPTSGRNVPPILRRALTASTQSPRQLARTTRPRWQTIGIIAALSFGPIAMGLILGFLGEVLFAPGSNLTQLFQITAGTLGILGLGVFVFSPTILAWRLRHKHIVGIVLVNALVGWTGFLLIPLIIWALMPIERDLNPTHPAHSQ